MIDSRFFMTVSLLARGVGRRESRCELISADGTSRSGALLIALVYS